MLGQRQGGVNDIKITVIITDCSSPFGIWRGKKGLLYFALYVYFLFNFTALPWSFPLLQREKLRFSEHKYIHGRALNCCSDSEVHTISGPACHSGKRNNYQIGNSLAGLTKHTPKMSCYFVLLYFILFSWNGNPVFSVRSQELRTEEA